MFSLKSSYVCGAQVGGDAVSHEHAVKSRIAGASNVMFNAITNTNDAGRVDIASQCTGELVNLRKRLSEPSDFAAKFLIDFGNSSCAEGSRATHQGDLVGISAHAWHPVARRFS